MGLSLSISVGPYILCKLTQTASSEEVRYCPNSKCNKFKRETGDQYCPRCGTKIEVDFKPIVKKNVDHNKADEISQAINERLYHYDNEDNTCHIWMANMRVDGLRRLSLDSREKDVITVAFVPQQIEEETKIFCQFFDAELALLKKEYGEENVTVQWGYNSRLW